MSNAVRELDDVLRAIEDAIDATPVADATTVSEVYRTNDRHNQLEHLGVYVFPLRSRDRRDRSPAGTGLGFIEDTIQIRLRYTLRGQEGQKAAIKRVTRYARQLRAIVTEADPAARARWDREDYTFEGNQAAHLTLIQTYLTMRTGFVGRC